MAPTWLSQLDAIDAQVTDLAPGDMAWGSGPSVAKLLPAAPKELRVARQQDRLAITWLGQQARDFMLIGPGNIALEAWRASGNQSQTVLNLRKLPAGRYVLSCDGQPVYELWIE